jgi:tetratricopeptide (TPR) repeat protein
MLNLTTPLVGNVPPTKIEVRNQAIHFHNQATHIIKQDTQTAYRLLCSAVTIDPEFADGWYQLGNANADLKLLPAAIAAFNRALSLPNGAISGDMTDDLRARCYTNLGHRLYHSGRIDEAYTATKAAIDLDEKQAFAHTNMSMIQSLRAQHDDAIASAVKGFELKPEAMTELGVAFAHLFAGNYMTGLKYFESRFPYQMPALLNMPYPRWDGGKLDGKTLVVMCDQGLGDTLCYARFLWQARHRVGHVIVMVQHELYNYLNKAFGHRDSGISFRYSHDHLPYADAWCPIVSLPLALGLTNDQFIKAPGFKHPDLPPTPSDWKHPLAKIHVGIAWSGSAANEIDKWRSIEFNHFLRLAEVAGVGLYSLQVGEQTQHLYNSGSAAVVRDLSPWIKDCLDTAAFIKQLDLVISIESFVAHLAAAVGTPCWVLASRYGGDYRIGRDRSTPIWAPDTKVMWQKSPPYWDDTLNYVSKLLADKIR